jgi:hypothetical protein
MRTIMLLAFCLTCNSLYSAEDLHEDPSLKPITKVEGRSGERIRISADFNGDGIKDMALSSDTTTFGNAGGNFTIYLRTKLGEFRKLGDIFLHPKAITIESGIGNPRIWVYIRSGGSSGKIGYHEIQKNGLSKFKGIAIYPGTGGTDMGRAIYSSVFSKSSVFITAERSSTKNKFVTWHKMH